MKSLWKETKIDSFKPLEKDITTQVLVVGGGMAGVLCAYLLKEANIPCVLVEANTIASGVTGNTTAKINFGHGLFYDKTISSLGVQAAGRYLEINKSALERYRELCRDIDCDFKIVSNYVYSINDAAVIEKEIVALKKLGFNAEFVRETPLPFEIAGAVRYSNQAQFNPKKFIAAITKDLEIYEHTCVQEISGTTALTDKCKISANQIIVATHFPFMNKYGGYFLKLYQERSYVIALENAQNVNGMYIEEKKNGLSFRNYGDLLLLGGGGHRTGKKGGNYKELREFAAKYYPKAREKFHWATQDCMSLDGVPYIGRYSEKPKDIYVATGFNKWGMTSSMVAAMLLRDKILGNENPAAEVFSPQRSIFHPQLAVNIAESTLGLLTPTAKRCPHLGCALKWNPVEHSWDCPCHGSRFERNGRLIDNPATGNLKTKTDG